VESAAMPECQANWPIGKIDSCWRATLNASAFPAAVIS